MRLLSSCRYCRNLKPFTGRVQKVVPVNPPSSVHREFKEVPKDETTSLHAKLMRFMGINGHSEGVTSPDL